MVDVRFELTTNDPWSVDDAICEVTGRRHRVSPCRSAYFASPWWLLTLDLVDVVEKQLYYSQSRDGI